MEIIKTKNSNTITLALSGRLDSLTSQEFSNEIDNVNKEGSFDLVFDFEKLDYISSAGLRVLLTTQKHAKAQGTTLEISNVNESVMEVFDMTGFSGILTIN